MGDEPRAAATMTPCVSRNVMLRLQYDGTGLHGFQRQKGDLSVQEALEQAIREVTGEQPVLAAAGRTDAGVHALGQVVSFRTASALPLERLPWALNAHLPPAIVVQEAREVPPHFHARFSARSKVYRYSIQNTRFPVPMLNRYAYLWRESLNVAVMDEAAHRLVGRQDFAAFRATGSSARTSLRNVLRCSVEAAPLDGVPEGRLVQIWVEADGFLYNMVRIIAGTLLEIGAGRRDPQDVERALASGDRRLAGKTLPPYGLCLVQVHYDKNDLGPSPA